MIKFYFHRAPNPMKVALFLEEIGLPYEAVPVDILNGEQLTPEYLAINPNGKTPAIVDGDAVDGPVNVFDSNAILLYLAEKTGRFLPPHTPVGRAQLFSWMMFIASGIGPYSGQAVHFNHYAPEKLPYAIERYRFEAERHWKILDARLAKNRYLLGSAYTIADMAAWGWAKALPFVLGDQAPSSFPNVQRLVNEIDARPAAVRAEALKARFAFKKDMDDAARRNMFRHTAKS